MTINKAVGYAMVNILAEQNTTRGKLCSDKQHGERMEHNISNVVIGRTKNPSIKTIHDFCCLTGYTLEEFFARKEFDDLE